MKSSSSWLMFCGLVCVMSAASACVWADESPAGSSRIMLGVKSTQTIRTDLRYLMDLADRGTAYENLFKENIDFFFTGLDETLPARIDTILDAETGQRQVWCVPLADIKEFINDNLDPIDIKARRVRTDPTLYELSGTVIENGYMRILSGTETYAVISELKADVPADVPHPGVAHDPLIKEGFGSFAYLKNLADGMELREKAADKVRDNTLDGIQKRPEESKEAFELRKFTAQQSLDFVGRLFAQTGEAKLGSRIDQEEVLARMDLKFSALPNTALAETIDSIAQQPSRFAAIPSVDGALLTARVNFPLDAQTRGDYKKLYELTRPVVAQQIDEDKDSTAGEKAARKQISELLLNVLTASTVQESIDFHISIVPSGEFHNVLLAVRSQGQADLTRLIDLIPAANEGWLVRRDVALEHEVAIHEISLGDKLAESTRKFYGTSGIVYVGIGPETFWLAAGEGSLPRLKEAIAVVKNNPVTAGDGTLVVLQAKVRPLLENAYQTSQEQKWDLTKLLKGQAMVPTEPREKGTQPGSERARPAVGDGFRAQASALRHFQWQQAAIDALKGFDDSLEVTIKRTESGTVEGAAIVRKGMMRAAGELIAKFAKENLE